jgi:ribosome-binding protein aMBF1 (putative translation factor)
MYIINRYKKIMDHQDFKVVVLRKKSNSPPKQNVPKNVEKKDDGEIVVPKTFNMEFGRKLSTLRVEKNLKRKDLALKLNLKESVIADIENGKYIYDGGIVHKLKKLFPTL